MDCFYEGYIPPKAKSTYRSLLEWLNHRQDFSVPSTYTELHQIARSLWADNGIQLENRLRPDWTLNDDLMPRARQRLSGLRHSPASV